MRRHTRSAALALIALGSVACGGTNDGPPRPPEGVTESQADVGGTLVIAAADPDALFPPAIKGAPAKMVTDLLFDPLATIGPDMNTFGDAGFEKRLADSWTWSRDSLSIAFHLDPRARWHDGRPVRAEDVRFTFLAYTSPEVGSGTAENVRDIDSVTVRDSSTAVFWFRRRLPEQFFQAVYHMAVVPAHRFSNLKPAEYAASEAARAPVGTGRFRFVKWTPGTSVELRTDSGNFRGRAKLDRLLWTVAGDPATTITRLATGDADFLERIGPADLPQVARHEELRVQPYAGLNYGYMAFNLLDGASARPHPLFGDRELRRALTRALDRQAMVRNVWDSLAVPALGPFVRSFSSSDTTIPQLAFDPAAAARTLDSLGWRDANGDGVRERNGRPLAFTITVPSTSPQRVQYAVLIQERLGRVGAKVTVDPLEFGAYLERVHSGKFDAQISATMTDPSASTVRQFWGGSATRAKNGSNTGSYVSREFDTQIDSATTAFDPAEARKHYQRAYGVIVADAPAVWLYEPSPMAAVRRQVKVAGMRTDAWWAGIADWSISRPAGGTENRAGLADRR